MPSHPPCSGVRAVAARLPSLLFLALLILASARAHAAARPCPDLGALDGLVFIEDLAGSSPVTPACFGQGCYPILNLGPYARKVDPACNPQIEGCEVELRVPFESPGNTQFPIEGNVLVYWFAGGTPPASCNPTPSEPLCGQLANCGVIGLDGSINVDFSETILRIPGLRCSNLNHPAVGTYSVSLFTCRTAACPRRTDVPGLEVSPPVFAQALGCVQPLMDACSEGGESCQRCPRHGTSAGGKGPSIGGGGDPALGPGAKLRYAAGGVGALGAPGSALVKRELGHFWMHDYAERIVMAPDPSHVFLLTRYSTYREFRDGDADGAYEFAAPSDEYRQLSYTGSGWFLAELDGTVHSFDGSGRWQSTTDKNGNAKTASYPVGGGPLESVSFPDGRSETFAYDLVLGFGTGKLQTITEVGVDGLSTRVWTYGWVAQDLKTVTRPDGTKIEFFYGDSRYPGFVTRMELVSTSNTRRVLRAWEYDGSANVSRAWSGSASATGSGAVDVWTFAYDNPTLPAETTVTDPLGQVSIYTLERDTVSPKPKVTQLSGDCPACSLGPNTQLIYDLAHPLRVAAEIDGEGHRTEFTYDSHGQRISRTEAADVPALARTTTWTYHPSFPAFPTAMRQPSTSGVGFRESSSTYDALTGDLLTRTESGAEATFPGGAFVLSTESSYNPAGQPLTIDPPGYGTADRTIFTYDPLRGNLLPLTRTDPLVGTTTFAYDAFNRVTTVTRQNHPDNEVSTTIYDPMNRLTESRRLAAAPADDLVTRHFYDVFGDLVCSVLPEGNGTQSLYDTAGRLIEQRRGEAISNPSATNCLNTGLPRERMVYTLNALGNRIGEKRERSTGQSTWATEAETSFVYSSRCHLDKAIAAPGRPEEAVTEYAYDCNGRLQRVWDANHPSAGQANSATQVYEYDALDRLITLTQPWAGAGVGPAITSYSYDVQDHLASVTDGEGNLTSYVTSDRDVMTGETSPVSGPTSHSYNEHGELISTTDARPVAFARAVDAADRVTQVDYPGTELDISYLYDDPLVDFSLGRLTKITRGGSVVDYGYDRFGRTIQDGALTHTYDKNGNPLTVVYPGAVTASTTFDFADREASLIIQRPGEPNQTLVSAATYKPFGPLATATLGNTRTETRSFDFRYQPTRIQLSAGLLDWAYSTDDVGNITSINDQTAANQDRTFAYQDFAYFLTQGDGPWGARAWTYDKIGNRLTETRSGVTDGYVYQGNGGGNTPKLTQVNLGSGGSRAYTYLASGHVSQVAATGNTVTFTTDDAARTSRVERSAELFTNFSYDGRDFLSQAAGELPPAFVAQPPAARGTPGTLIFQDGFEGGDACLWTSITGLITPLCPKPTPISATPTYSSDGTLRRLLRFGAATGPEEIHFFYFAGRPLAQLEIDGGDATFKWLTSDHLGTPVVATSNTGAVLWSGGFEAFGADWNNAAGANIELRLPGQWTDAAWEQASLGAGVVYNVHRWYEQQTGRYTRVDPLGLGFGGGKNLYLYGRSNPLRFADQMGLFEVDKSCKEKCGEFGPKDAIDKGIPQFQQATEAPRCKNLLSMHKGFKGKNLYTLQKECDRSGTIACDCADTENYGKLSKVNLFGPVVFICGGNFRGSTAPNSPFQRAKYGLGTTIFHECLHWARFGGAEPGDGSEAGTLFQQILDECVPWSPE